MILRNGTVNDEFSALSAGSSHHGDAAEEKTSIPVDEAGPPRASARAAARTRGTARSDRVARLDAERPELGDGSRHPNGEKGDRQNQLARLQLASKLLSASCCSSLIVAWYLVCASR